MLPLAAAAALARQPAPEACSAATWYLAHGDSARALRALEGFRGGPAANLRGLAEMLEGRFDAALTSFAEASAADPEAWEPRLNRAVVLLRQGSAAAAAAELDALHRSVAHPRPRAAIAYHRALAAERLGRLEEASAWIDRALEADPDSADALLLAGVLLERRGRFAEAGRRYRAYLDRHPDSLVGMLRFGVVAHRAGHRDLAIRYLREVSSRVPESREAVEARKFLVMWE